MVVELIVIAVSVVVAVALAEVDKVAEDATAEEGDFEPAAVMELPLKPPEKDGRPGKAEIGQTKPAMQATAKVAFERTDILMPMIGRGNEV